MEKHFWHITTFTHGGGECSFGTNLTDAELEARATAILKGERIVRISALQYDENRNPIYPYRNWHKS